MHIQDNAELIPLAQASSLVTPVNEQSDTYLSGIRLIVVMASFMLLTAMAGIDQTISTAALVTITSQFNAISDIAWITSAFFISQSCFMLLYGKILNIAPPKTVVLFSAVTFELGNLFSGIASSASVLIFGRVLAGIGAAGTWVSILSTIGRIGPVSKKPLLISLVASAIGLSSVLGPVLGGALSERVTWRWCFYINLPFGCFAIFAIFVLVPDMAKLTIHEKSALDTWLKLDWIGAVLNILGVFLFLTGLQWGGNTKPWDDPGVVVTIIIGFIFLCLFIAWEIRKGPDAILATVMFRRRNVLGSFLVSTFVHWAMVIALIYVSILYQLRGHSVIKSSVELLYFIGAGILGTAISGAFFAITGRVWIWLFVPPFLGTAAFAILAVSTIHTNLPVIAVCQLIIGFSLGTTAQNCIVVVQAEYADKEELVPQATSLITFAGVLSNAIGSAVAGVVFSTVLKSQIQGFYPNLQDPLRTAVLQNIDTVLALPESLRVPLVNAYVTAISRNFFCGAAVIGLGGLSALLVENKKVSIKLTSESEDHLRQRGLKPDASYYDEIFKQYQAEPYIPLLGP